ncbi:hypothetical protein TRIUR3_03583 [Triticum urartu]|uniref:Uncharacterized protein n=1 Tax=Triticum urartu TaxID=4572 RepID=M8ANR3_TRIUA|nr:hypothetical protein TRIUR3_03583 [Triticum urartu]
MGRPITTLTLLYVGVWKLPGTAALRGASFPHLRELGLGCVEMEQGVVDSLVARSPVLEVLNILGCKAVRLRLVSQSLRCVQISWSRMEDVAVVLKVRDTIIMSKRCTEPTGNYLTLQFWEESDPEENLVSRITVMSFREFTGDPGEVGFLEFFFRSARALETASVSMANPSFTPFSTQEAYAKVKRSSRIMASESNMVVLGSTGPAGGGRLSFSFCGEVDLVLVNRPWPRDVPLPPTIFAITTLTRLYVGLWKLPDTAALRGASFPHLRELGLCCVEMEQGVVDSLVARSPVLEVLNILGCINGLRLRLLSQSLRCLQISCSKMEHIAVVKAPCLERLILFGSGKIDGGLCSRLKIGDVPKLHAFGYLDPGQVLQIRDTIIMSEKCDKPTGNHLGLKFWEESGPIENVLSRINVTSIREFRGDPGEVGFLEFIFWNALALKTVFVSMANPSFTPFSTEEAYAKVKYCYRNKASKSCQMAVIGSTGPSGGEVWRFKDGADFSFHDPFSQVEEAPRLQNRNYEVVAAAATVGLLYTAQAGSRQHATGVARIVQNPMTEEQGVLAPNLSS